MNLEDSYISKFLAIKLLTVGVKMQKRTRPLHLRWKVVYKLVNTIDSSFKKQIVDAEKYEQAGGPKRKIDPVRVNPNEIVIEKKWEELFMNPDV